MTDDGRPGILVLIKGLDLGGAERLVATGAPLWDRSTFRYHVAYVLPDRDELVPDVREAGIPVHCLGGVRGLTPAVLWRLRRLVVRLGIDLVHAHLPVTGVLARLVSPVPVVYTEHNLAGSYRLPTRVANFMTYRRNRVSLAVSEAVAESIHTYPGPSVVVIPNGVAVEVDPREAVAARTELGLGPTDRLVVHVGNVKPGKGHRTLIEAATLLAEDFPHLTIASLGAARQEGDLERLRAQAARVGAEPILRFLGGRDALAFLAAADVFVNPASVEGLPVAVLEAMALGRPVVATRAGGVPSVVHDGATGLLVDPDDPVGLAEAVSRLLDDPELAQTLARSAKELVEAEFGLERMVRRVEDHYRAVLGLGAETVSG